MIHIQRYDTMTYYRLLLCLSFSLAVTIGLSQSSYVVRSHPAAQTIDTLDVLHHTSEQLHSSNRRYAREDLLQVSNLADTSTLSNIDNASLNNIIKDNQGLEPYRERKGFLKHFYKNPVHLYQAETEDFSLVINPKLNIKLGYETESSELIFHNGRGLELYGALDNKIYFYTSFMENQSNFFNYQEPFIDEFQTVRGIGNFKTYQSSVFESISGYDYGRATAYFGVNISKHTKLELGHDRHFIGNGMRSLLLGDEGPNYFYLKFNARFWKFDYQTLFAELTSISAKSTPNDNLLPKKFMATHYLSYKPNPKFELGFFESIVFARENQFELQYLNPVIFYRTVEFQLDSPDNVLLGLNLKYNPIKQVSLYGQILLDEFRADEIFSSRQWWGNKYGLQFGIKYYNVLGISNLDVQLEYNRVRPYTYSHREPTEEFPDVTVSNYSHSFQPLAHPLGANFTENIIRVGYQPFPRLNFTFRFLSTRIGRDIDANYGSNVLRPDVTRVANFGNAQNQGSLSNIRLVDLKASFRLFHNGFIDIDLLSRHDRNEDLGDIRTFYLGTGFRYNFSSSSIDY